MRSWWMAGALGVLVSGASSAQTIEGGRSGPRHVMDHEEEIALALSAAPAAVSEAAKVLVWNGDGFDVAREGGNGVTCYVARSWPESLEPHCFDAEGARTILPIHMKQMEWWDEGWDESRIDAEIAERLRTGEFRLPIRPVMSYMMSAGQQLISDEGQPVGSWRPHLMIYYPWLTEADLGPGSIPDLGSAVVVDPGTPFSNIMIVVNDFVSVAETEGGAGSGVH